MKKARLSVKSNQTPCLKGDNDDDNNLKHGFNDIPECLQNKILTCLPLKSVFMFKTVSKQWNSYISAPDFSKSYIAANQRDSTNRSLLLARSNYNCNYDLTEGTYLTMSQRLSAMNNALPFTMLDFPFPKLPAWRTGHRRRYKVISSNNGLLLCRRENGMVYGVCNPITRQWIVLPRHELTGFNVTSCKEAFVAKVDESSSKLISYRVVRLHVHGLVNPGPFLGMEVYDSDMKKWIRKEVNHLQGKLYLSSKQLQPACLNEIIYWRVERVDGTRCVFALDPYKHGEDLGRLIALPTVATFWSDKTLTGTLLGVCNGKLQYLEVYTDSIAIWALENYEEEKWERKHMITGVNLNYRGGDVCHPLAFHPLESKVIYMRSPGQIISTMLALDIEKKTFIPLNGVQVHIYDVVFPFLLPVWPPIIDDFVRGN